jgi:hypothetical protein
MDQRSTVPVPSSLPVIPVYQHSMITPTCAGQPATVRLLVIPRLCVAARQRDDGVNGEDSGGYFEGLVSAVSVTVTHESGKDRQGGAQKNLTCGRGEVS